VGDLAVQDLNADQQLALLEVRHQKRQQLDDALQRLEAGTYGLCEDCGKPIGKERLEVLPFARRCISCQEQAEALERIEREPERQE
jgi:DnaK suppressor protein